MSGFPDPIPDFGSPAVVLRQNPVFEPTRKTGFGTEDYFLWSRIDGRASLRDVIIGSGWGIDHALNVLRRLRRWGAVLLPGETEPPPPPPPTPAHEPSPDTMRRARMPLPPSRPGGGDTTSRRARADATTAMAGDPGTGRGEPTTQRGAAEPPFDTGRRASDTARRGRAGSPRPDSEGDDAEQPIDPTTLYPLSEAEESALAERCDIAEDEKLRMIAILRRVDRGNYFQVLGVEETAARRELKRAYFRLSKQFHPDRYYGRDLGSFRPWLTRIFETANRALEVLSDDAARAEYVAGLRGTVVLERKPSTRDAHARAIFDRACRAETEGRLTAALGEFAAAVRLDPQVRFIRRAALCALRARELKVAEEYAKKAAELASDDPSAARLLAEVYRAAGRLVEAEATLVGALKLKTENDALTKGLQADLAALRRELGTSE